MFARLRRRRSTADKSGICRSCQPASPRFRRAGRRAVPGASAPFASTIALSICFSRQVSADGSRVCGIPGRVRQTRKMLVLTLQTAAFILAREGLADCPGAAADCSITLMPVPARGHPSGPTPGRFHPDVFRAVGCRADMSRSLHRWIASSPNKREFPRAPHRHGTELGTISSSRPAAMQEIDVICAWSSNTVARSQDIRSLVDHQGRLSRLFYGPPGTVKTAAGRLIGARLKLDEDKVKLFVDRLEMDR